MPGPSSSTLTMASLPREHVETRMVEPACVWVTALFTRLTTTWTISLASTLTRRRSSHGSISKPCWQMSGLAWRNASSMMSSRSSTVVFSWTFPFSRRVMARRFSTVAFSQFASDRMSRSSSARLSALSASPSESRTSAFPEIAVSGVRRSCEIERRRLARSCSFLASTAASSRCSSAWMRLSARDASPTTASASFCSAGSGVLLPRQAPITPITSSSEMTGR